MKFYIITPSFNQLAYLKRCVASVRDQVSEVGLHDPRVSAEALKRPAELVESVKTPNGSLSAIPASTCNDLNDFNESGTLSVHHHIQDGGSTDGTREFLEKLAAVDGSSLGVDGVSEALNNGHSATYQLSFASEADEGMYDAVSKGWRRFSQTPVNSEPLSVSREDVPNNGLQITDNCDDEIVAWLNCDEQYLPGTLRNVGAFFEANSRVDILFGGMLMVDPAGRLLACRKAMPMRRLFLEASYLYNFSCAMFIRKPFWNRLGGFDPAYRNAGDEALVRRAMSAGAKTAALREYLSVFTWSEGNLSSTRGALEEHEALKQAGSAVSRRFRLPINLLRLAEKALRAGHIQQAPVIYEIYTDDRPQRCRFEVDRPPCKWPGEARPYLVSHRLK